MICRAFARHYLFPVKMTDRKKLIDKLKEKRALENEEWAFLISGFTESDREYAAALAREEADIRFGKSIFIRGLIEFSNVCKNDCLYCGIRKSNKNVERYTLSADEILSCCETGYNLGFRTFVLQSGEGCVKTDYLCGIVSEIKKRYPDCAVTLSAGELERAEYQKLFDAGADRYLLRHETASRAHYEKLHPVGMSFDNRMRCLRDLKEIGYQVGCGFMVGSPYQTPETLAEDMTFISKFSPHMVGIGPFISHADTPFADKENGDVNLTLFLLSLLRLLHPDVLLPATTALGTLDPMGREKGIMSGANVIMPNLSPGGVREKYTLYDNKICTGEEAAECIKCLSGRIESIGYKIVKDRGDFVADRINKEI